MTHTRMKVVRRGGGIGDNKVPTASGKKLIGGIKHCRKVRAWSEKNHLKTSRVMGS